MKRDCPNCNESMDGEFLHWRKFAKQDHSRACPICGKAIQLRAHPEEIAVRALAIIVVIGAAYLAKERAAGYLAILVTTVLILAIAFGLVHLRLRDRQRFMKGRSVP